METVCKLTNNGKEVQDIVAAIRKGHGSSIKSHEEIAEISAALTHLCNMTDSLTLQADVSPSMLTTMFSSWPYMTRRLISKLTKIIHAPVIATKGQNIEFN